MKPIAADEMFPEGIDIEDVSNQLRHKQNFDCLHFS